MSSNTTERSKIAHAIRVLAVPIVLGWLALTVVTNVFIPTLEKVAEALGASQSQILDWMIANTDVDAHGRPSWFTGPLPTDVDKELPLASVS